MGLKGKCYGDRGYLSFLLEKELHLVAKIRKNMKNTLLTLNDKLNLMKKGGIEAVNDILMTVCDIDHTRHRNPLNALVHILSGLTVYTFLDHKTKGLTRPEQSPNSRVHVMCLHCRRGYTFS